MDPITDILIGIGLAMDASAVSIVGGANTGKPIRAAILAGLAFGAFQAGMLLIGGMGGESVRSVVSGIDHWIAFALLAFVGGKMVLEAATKSRKGKKYDLLDASVLAALAIATSIDSLAVGFGIAFADNYYLLTTAITVGVVTAALSSASVLIGRRYGCEGGCKVEIAGGLILIAIGLNILRTHLGGL